MSIFESRQLCEIINVSNDSRFHGIFQSNPSGIAVIAEPYGEDEVFLLPSDTDDFVKWIKQTHPAIPLQTTDFGQRLLLQSNELWLPAVLLAPDVMLSDYLNLVLQYLEFKVKSALKSDIPRVHFSVLHKDGSGAIKRFNYEGDGETLKSVIKKLDLNQFLDE